MDNSFQMSLWNLQNERHRWRRILYVTKKHYYHHHHHNHLRYHKHRAHKDFQHFLQDTRYTLQDGIESDDDSFTGNEGDESDTNTSDNDCDSGSSDEKVYTLLP